MKRLATMPRRLLLLLAALLAAYAAAAGYGYDRRPVVTGNDEIFWAEPAWSLLHGDGYRMPCCDGNLFGDFYPAHPPVYALILAGSFRLFGFTAPAMRLPSVAARAAGLDFVLVDTSIPEQRAEWLAKPHPFAGFDAIVLRADHELTRHPDLAEAKTETVPEVGGHEWLFFELRRPR